MCDSKNIWLLRTLINISDNTVNLVVALKFTKKNPTLKGLSKCEFAIAVTILICRICEMCSLSFSKSPGLWSCNSENMHSCEMCSLSFSKSPGLWSCNSENMDSCGSCIILMNVEVSKSLLPCDERGGIEVSPLTCNGFLFFLSPFPPRRRKKGREGGGRKQDEGRGGGNKMKGGGAGGNKMKGERKQDEGGREETR